MFNKFAFATLVLATLSTAAVAVDVTPPASAVAPNSAAALNSLAPMAGDAKPAAAPNQKVDYDKLNRAEKIKFINERHEANLKKAAEKWKAMSDDQKIAKYEKRRNAFMARRAAKGQQNAAAAVNNLQPAAGIAPAGNVNLNPTPVQETSPAAGTTAQTPATATPAPAKTIR